MCCRGTQLLIMLQMNLSQLKSIYMIAEECIRLNTTNYFQNVYMKKIVDSHYIQTFLSSFLLIIGYNIL